MPSVKVHVGFKGLNTELAPSEMKGGWAEQLVNWLVHKDGTLVRRGGISFREKALAGSPVRFGGVWTLGNTTLASTGDSGSFLLEQAYEGAGSTRIAPITTANGGCIYSHDGESNVTFTADNAPGPSWVRAGSFVYGAALGSTASDTIGSVTYSRPVLLRWSGSSVPTTYANGPTTVAAVTYHYNRLIVAAWADPGGAPAAYNKNTLYYSIPYDATAALTDAAASWQDPLSGAYQKIVVGQDDADDFIVGLARLGTGLAVLKRRSIWMIYGETPLNWTVRRVTAELGCGGPECYIEHDDSVVFSTPEGRIFAFDGSQFSELTRHVRELFVGGTSSDPIPLQYGGGDYLVTGGGYACHLPTRRWTFLSINADPAFPFHFRRTTGRGIRAYGLSGSTSYVSSDLSTVFRGNTDDDEDGPMTTIWYSPIITPFDEASNIEILRLLTTERSTSGGTAPDLSSFNSDHFLRYTIDKNPLNDDTVAAEMGFYHPPVIDGMANFRRDVFDAHGECPYGAFQIQHEGTFSTPTYGGVVTARFELHAPIVEIRPSNQRRQAAT